MRLAEKFSLQQPVALETLLNTIGQDLMVREYICEELCFDSDGVRAQLEEAADYAIQLGMPGCQPIQC